MFFLPCPVQAASSASYDLVTDVLCSGGGASMASSFNAPLTTIGLEFLPRTGASASYREFGGFAHTVPPFTAGAEGEGEGEGEGGHSADQDGNSRINLTELLRIIQFYNSGGFHCADDPASTEDGYVPGSGANHSCAPHSSDYAPSGPDWQIKLTELLRVIQFYNSGGYHACPGEGTEDGFCPGL